ncbi:MAG: TetR/AcrR family transcriptional regulator [Acidimicrobiales bacterium]
MARSSQDRGTPQQAEESSAGQDLRRRRAEVSRQAIRDAVTELLLHEHPSTLSIPAVAAKAGVSVRTVYRYFPTKQHLLDDVAEIQQRRADEIMDGRQDLFDNPGQYLAAMWTDFERDVEAIRAQHLSPLGRELRSVRMEKVRADLRVRLDKAFPEADQQDRDDLSDLIMTIMSSGAFLDLHTRLGRGGADAARLAWWAVGAMQKQFKADGGMDKPRAE